MNLYIDNEKIDVSFLDNDSVKDLCSLKPLTITMTRYGGFEQVGEIGKIIKSNDYRMTTEPGDIVLYNSNNIVIFFGSNTWEYTKLGHINLTKEELKKILDKEKVNLRIE